LNLDSSKSLGLNSIPVQLSKTLGPKILHPLATMINQSSTNGMFPSKLKIAKIASIVKKGDPKILQITDQYPSYQYLSKFMKS